MKVPDPTFTATSPPVPPSNGSPSSVPVKSMTTRSPFSTLPPSPFAANGRFCSAILSSASPTCGVGHLRHRTLELDALEIGELDLRQHLDRERIGEIGLPADDLGDLGLLVRDRDLGFHGELEAMIGDDLGVELANHRLDGLRHHGLAVDLSQVRHRHLARPEAAQLHLVLELAQALGEPRLEIGGRHLDLEFALEAVGESFCDFHDDNLHVLAASAAAIPWT